MSVHIDPADLAALVAEPGTVVVDTRGDLVDPEVGPAAYAAAHVPGAVYLGRPDWSDPADPVAGQLAPPGRFAEVLGAAGIGPDTTVVAYDDGTLFLASRLVWALRHYGHAGATRILAGGFPAWAAAGLPSDDRVPEPDPVDYPTPVSGDLRATLDEVADAVETASAALVDCRMESTWTAAGAHIPGATHLPAPDLFDPRTGRPLPADRLAALAAEAGVGPDRPTILYCGGGVSAAAAYVALTEAGVSDLRVYDGSWSEWSTTAGTAREPHA